MQLPDTQGIRSRRVPVQLLEAGWSLLVLIAACLVWDYRPFPGALFLGGLAAHSAGRFLLQFGRAEQERLGPLNLSRALAVTSIGLALVGLAALQICAGLGLGV